jgi:hypothetical protein
LVGILDPEDENPAGVPGIEPVEKRGSRASNMKETRRTRGEADTYLGHEWKFRDF